MASRVVKLPVRQVYAITYSGGAATAYIIAPTASEAVDAWREAYPRCPFDGVERLPTGSGTRAIVAVLAPDEMAGVR